jgi:hypothetical protein
MTLAYPSLWILVLLVTGSVVAMPMAMRDTTPVLAPSREMTSGAGEERLWLVESLQGRWFINGRSLSRLELEKLLQLRPHQLQIYYLPSDALPIDRVSQSLRWLRHHTPGTVTLELYSSSRSYAP